VSPRQLARPLLLAGALSAALLVAGRWPQAQTVHYLLGDSAGHVQELDARWTAGDREGEPVGEVSFRYPLGSAPRIVTHQPSLSDGPYTVALDVVADGQRTSTERHVTLGGGTVLLDVSASARPGDRSDRHAMSR